jgi:hypothetical protein
MHASKLITLSTVALLLGGTSLAIGQGSLQSGGPAQEGSTLGQSSVRGFETKRMKAPRAYARATARELEAGLSAQERTRLMQEIPRLSSIGTEPRVNAIVPPSVRMAAAPLPPEIQRKYPRLRNNRAFIYRGQVVIMNPTTSRIVALAATGS